MPVRRRHEKTTEDEDDPRARGGRSLLHLWVSEQHPALHFHHVEPAEKRLELNAKGISLALDTLRAEAQKCVLLCSNCHAEVEDGTAFIPAHALEERFPG